jgi:hypothetical protein
VSTDVSEEHIAFIFGFAGFLVSLFFDPEDGGGMLALNGLHGVISQKMVHFITTAVRTVNPTYTASYPTRW